MTNKQDKYRPDIDGLRAVAVLAVIAFHTEVPRFRNGFLGVDIFFVISGYLISGIIFDGLERNSFSFREFYVRRINRILPALITVVVAIACMGWFILYDYEFQDLGQHVMASSVFLSNFLLLRETGYFDLPAKPLLHLWSLAVEEQFYLFFPITALLAWRSSQKTLSWVLRGIVAGSFTWGIVLIATGQPVAAFYLPFGRFWEIISGALLQNFERRRSAGATDSPLSHPWRTEIAAACGVALLAAGMAIHIPEGTWPGWRALFPVLGTMLLIASGESWLNRRVLGIRALVAIGLISYPLYLWHWPLLAYSRLLLVGYIPPRIAALAVATSFLLAVLTYRFIEIPIRFGARKRRSALILLCFLPLLAIVGGLMLSGLTGTRSSGGPLVTHAWGPGWLAPSEYTVDHGNGVIMSSLRRDTTRTVFLYGDSHMNHYWPRVLELAGRRTPGFPTVSLLAYGGCIPLPGVNRRGTDWASKPWECDRLYQAALNYARTPRVTTIVFSAWWDVYTRAKIEYLSGDTSTVPITEGDPRLDKVFDAFARDLESLVSAGKRVYIVLPSPTPGTQVPPSRLPQRLISFEEENKVGGLSRALFDKQTGWVTAKLKSVAAQSGARAIDPAEFLCAGKVCPTHGPGGMPIYRDDNHLRAGYVERYVSYLDEAFK